MTTQNTSQTIGRLTALAEVFAMLGTVVKPVGKRDVGINDAQNCILAADVMGPLRPAHATALHDGWAVRAEDLSDAGSYSAAVLAAMPARVETGDTLPAGTDAVAPADTIAIRNGVAEATSAVAPGEGVLAAGADSDPAQPLRRAGQRLRSADIAALIAAEIEHVSVRVPRIKIILAREDMRLLPALQFIARDCLTQGAEPVVQNGAELTAVLQGNDNDMLVIVGGTGTGGRDRSISALAALGRVLCHGIGLTPGETAALGEVKGRPVLIVPGRLDAALAVWLVVGRAMLRLLSAAQDDAIASSYSLTRKVTSTVGMVEFVPVCCVGDTVEPLAMKFLPLSVLTKADGFILVPADSEGYAPGAKVAVKALS